MAKLRTSCDKIVSGISKIAFRAVFKDLNMTKLKPVALRDKFALAQATRPLISKGVLKIKLGDFLTKLNLTSGGKSKQFFQLIDEVSLRWASNKEKVQNIKKCHSCNFAVPSLTFRSLVRYQGTGLRQGHEGLRDHAQKQKREIAQGKR